MDRIKEIVRMVLRDDYQPQEMNEKLKSKINDALVSFGFNGTNEFNSNQVITKIIDILDGFDVQIIDDIQVVKKTQAFNIGFICADPEDVCRISNARIVINWLEDGDRYRVISYLQ